MPSNEQQKQAPKQAEDTRHLLNRREFLGTLGTALGGVTMIGGRNFLLGQTALPSGYKFYRALTTGEPLITAKINATDPAHPCADWEVAAPVKLINRVMFIGLYDADTLNTPGDGPAYNPNAGAQMNADPSRKPTDINNFAKVLYGFPFATGTGPLQGVPVRVYLLDEKRKPVGVHLKITFDSGATAVLTQPASLSIPLNVIKRFFTLEWVNASLEDVNFSSLFILVIDGGCGFGQVEFWVNAWNWA